MKKKTRTMGILLTVLAVLLVIFLGLKQWNASKKKEEEARKKEETIHIFETDGLAKIAYEDGEGKSMAFEKQGDEWLYSPDPTIRLAADRMDSLEGSFSDITAVKEIRDPDDPEDYGLKDSEYRLMLTDTDGNDYVFRIGNQSGENYYFTEDGQDIVYTVSSDFITQMVWDISSVAEKDTFVAITEENFIKETVTTPDGSETVFDSADDSQKDACATVIGGLSGFYFTDCADYHVTDETLEKYGLEAESRTKVVLTYKDTDHDNQETELTFYIGDKDEDENYYYVQMEGSQMVNRVTTDSIEKVLGRSADNSEDTQE